MADWADLTTGSKYQTGVLAALNERTKALAKMYLSDQTSLPTGAMHLNVSDGKFQRWNGSSWSDLQFKAAALASNSVETAKILADAVTTAKFRGVNAAWLRWRNAADTADLAVLTVEGSNHTRLNADAGKELQLAISTSARWKLDGADTTNYPLLPVGDYNIGSAANPVKTISLSRGVSMPYNVATPTGTNQAGATALTGCGFWRIGSVTSTNRAIRLPPALKGDLFFLINIDTTDDAWIYCAVGDYMNNVLDGNFPLTATNAKMFICYSDGYLMTP